MLYPSLIDNIKLWFILWIYSELGISKMGIPKNVIQF